MSEKSLPVVLLNLHEHGARVRDVLHVHAVYRGRRYQCRRSGPPSEHRLIRPLP